MEAKFESEMIWNGKTWEIFLKLNYSRNQFVFFTALLKVIVIFLHDLKMQYGLGYKCLSWYISSLQSVGFLIGNVEFGLEIDYGGRGGGQESQFHSLFFMQAVIIAYNICTAKQHSN